MKMLHMDVLRALATVVRGPEIDSPVWDLAQLPAEGKDCETAKPASLVYRAAGAAAVNVPRTVAAAPPSAAAPASAAGAAAPASSAAPSASSAAASAHTATDV